MTEKMPSEDHEQPMPARTCLRREHWVDDRLEVIEYSPPEGVEPLNVPPLLFIHGAWADEGTWKHTFGPWFAERGYRGFALSLRGHGKSKNPGWLRLVRIRDYVQDVAAVADWLPRKPILIALSMGGFVAQKYLEDHEVPGAVLLAPAPREGTKEVNRKFWKDRPLRMVQSYLTFSADPVMATPELNHRSCFAPDMPKDQSYQFWLDRGPESVIAQLDMAFLDLPKPEKVHSPLLILGGELDWFFPPEITRRTAQAYGTEAIIISGMAHVIPLDPRWKQAAEKIDDWVRGLGIEDERSV